LGNFIASESQMSTRERWIVYPLLFLALGAALRDKFMGSRDLRAGYMTCGELRAGHLLCDRIESGQSECRQLIVRGPNGQPVVGVLADAQSGNGVIETVSATGSPLVRIASANGAGNVTILGRMGKDIAVLAQLPQLELRLPFGLQWGTEGDQAGKAPPEGQKKVPPPKKPPAKPER
jgi:hypothetical protein